MKPLVALLITLALALARAGGLSSEPHHGPPGLHAPEQPMKRVDRAELCQQYGCPVDGGG